MKAAVALSLLGGLFAIPLLGAQDGGAQLIPGLSGPSGATSVPGGRTPTPATTSTTIPGGTGVLGGAPAAAPSGSVGKTIRLGNPRTRPNPDQPEEDPGDMPPSGDDEPAPSPDGLGQGSEGGLHGDGQEHGTLGEPPPHGAIEEPGDADDADGMDEYEDEGDDDAEDAE